MSEPPTDATVSPNGQGLSRAKIKSAVGWNAALWTIGTGLTSGGFIDYFAQELGAFGLSLAMIATTPELAGLAGIGYGQLKPLVGGRLPMWIFGTVLSRIFLLGLPFAVLLAVDSQKSLALYVLWGALFLAGIMNGFASTAFFSWLSSLSQDRRGQFLGGRQLVVLLIQLVVPLAGAYFRDWARRGEATDVSWLAVYGIVFGAGIGLQLLSLLCMRGVPALEVDDEAVSIALRQTPRTERDLETPLLSPIVWLLLHAILLGAANGLTQSVISQFQFRELQMPLFIRYLLFDLMILVQIGTNGLAIRWIDSGNCKKPLLWGAILASFGILFYALADSTNYPWMLALSSICWGGFGAVNVAGPALAMKLAGPRDAGPLLAWFRLGPGFAAGVCGIVGGAMLSGNSYISTGTNSYLWLTDFQVLFLISFAFRLLAALLVIGVVEPVTRSQLSNGADNQATDSTAP